MTKPQTLGVEDLSLEALLKALQPVAGAIERAETALTKAQSGHRQAVAVADAARNDSIATAKWRRDGAEAEFQSAIRQAAEIHAEALTVAKRHLTTAQEQHASACTAAAPLLTELRRRQERIAGIVARAG